MTCTKCHEIIGVCGERCKSCEQTEKPIILWDAFHARKKKPVRFKKK